MRKNVSIFMLVLLAIPGTLPANQRWWGWTCATGVAMGLFGLWYVPILQRARARAAAARAAALGPAATDSASEATGSAPASSPPANTAPASTAPQDSPSVSNSRDNGSNTVSSTETPGKSTRS